MENPWVNGNFTFNMRDNLLFEKDKENFIDALGIQQLNTIGNIYLLDIYLMKDNSVEFHYHPNASELTYCIAGEAVAGFINPSTNEWQHFQLQPGEVISIPQGFWHYAKATKDDTHLLATHDTNNLQTMFGSDVLRETPKDLMAEIYCLNEAELEDALQPIEATVIIGPPADCERGLEASEKESVMQRPQMMGIPSENSDTPYWKHAEESMEEQTSVRYGGTVVKEMNLCESCMKKFSQ